MKHWLFNNIGQSLNILPKGNIQHIYVYRALYVKYDKLNNHLEANEPNCTPMRQFLV